MEEKLLREILSVTKENNEILKKLNFQRKWITFYWVAKWVAIIIIAYSAYRAATPYIESAQQTINSINSFGQQAQQFQNTMSEKSFTDFLRSEINKRLNQ